MKSLLYGYEGKLMHLKFLSGNESRLVIWADCMKYMNFNVPFSISSEYMMRITQYLHRSDLICFLDAWNMTAMVRNDKLNQISFDCFKFGQVESLWKLNNV